MNNLEHSLISDVDPCIYIHYSDSNIYETTLLELLQSPMMMQYHDNQPFNENMLRTCPMFENSEILPKMVKNAQASSTDLQSSETAEHLCEKLNLYDQILYTPMSSGLSGSMMNAKILENEYSNRFYVVDNHRISCSLKQSGLKALTMVQRY